MPPAMRNGWNIHRGDVRVSFGEARKLISWGARKIAALTLLEADQIDYDQTF